MKKSLICLLAFSLTQICFAQKIDYNKIILPASAENVDMGERLVQIAWENNPQNKAVAKEKEIAKQDLRLARWQWLDNIYGMGNFNEFTMNNDDSPAINLNNLKSTSSLFYPLYNVGVRLSLGDLVNTPLQTKRAKEAYKLADENINSRKLELRSLVLTNYQNYLMNKELLKIQNELTEDANASFSLAERKFKDGSLSFEEYNKATKSYNEERVNRIKAENAFMLSKIKLEEIVGIRMEDVE